MSNFPIFDENREKWAELIAGGGERWENQNQQLTLADLREEYEKWLRNHPCPVAQDQKLRLINPFTGEEVQDNEASIKFGLNFNPVKIKEPENHCLQKSQQFPNSPSLEDILRGQKRGENGTP